MILSKVLSKNQLTLPKEVVKALHIQKGALLKCQVENQKIILTPVIVEEPFTEEEFKKLEKLYKDPKNKGKTFHSAAEAIRYLNRL